MFLVEGQDHRRVNGYPRHQAGGGGRRGTAVDLLQVVRSSGHFAIGFLQQGRERLPHFVCNEVPSRLQPRGNPEGVLEAKTDTPEHVADLSSLPTEAWNVGEGSRETC